MKSLVAAAVFTLFAASSCTKKESQSVATPTPAVNETLLTAGKVLEKTASADTPYKMYQYLSADPKNICISPLSLEQAFSIAYLGSAGKTKALIEQLFGFKNDDVHSLKDENLGGDIKFFWGNSIWSKPGKTLSPSFLEAAKNKLEATHTNSIEVKKINAWIEKTTEGKITDLIKGLPLQTITVLVNAFYLNAPWEEQFQKSQMLFGPFQSAPSMSSQVTYLSRIDSMDYYEDKYSIWVELPYKGNTLSMLMALPKKKFDLRTVEDGLSTKYMDGVFSGLKSERVDLKFPKFKFDTSLSFSKVLSDMGYSDLFKEGDWSRMTMVPGALISEILQATYIKVDENGTEAAAATAMVMKGTGMPDMGSPKPFYANQPFLFMIRNKKTNQLYFIGRVFDPKI